MSPEILFISDIQAILEPLTLPRDSAVHHRAEKLDLKEMKVPNIKTSNRRTLRPE